MKQLIKHIQWLYNKKSQSTIGTAVRESEGINISLFEDNQPLRITIFRADGGLVVQTNHYDQKNDRNIANLHIINSSDNLGNCLSKIITVEMLRISQ
jgi:hypothetical protein